MRAPTDEMQARLGAPTTPMRTPETPRIDPSGDAENLETERDDDSEHPPQYEMSDDEDDTNDAEMGLLDIGHDEQAMTLMDQLGMVVQQRRRHRIDKRRTVGMVVKQRRRHPIDKRRKYTVSEVYSPPRITRDIARTRPAHLSPGLALDLTVNDPDDGKPWDPSQEDQSSQAVATDQADASHWVPNVHGVLHMAAAQRHTSQPGIETTCLQGSL